MRALALTNIGVMATVLVCASAARAETVALLPASGVNVHEGTLEAAGDLLRGELVRTGRFTVMVVPGPVTSQEPAPDAAVDAARAQGADLAAVLHLTRLGNTARLRLTAYAAGSGQMVFTDELPAATPDDMPPVLARLAKSFATGKPAHENADIETVTQAEAKALRKRHATHVFGLELGYLLPLHEQSSQQLALPGMAIFWLYDARSFLADVALGFHSNGSHGDYYVGLGAYYPFDRSDFTPYLGGGVRYSHSDYGGDGASGLSAQVGFGVLLGRLSSVQVRGEIAYFANLYGEDRYDANATTDTSTHVYSHGVAFNLGIGF